MMNKIGAFDAKGGIFGEITLETLRKVFQDIQAGKLTIKEKSESAGYVVLLENGSERLTFYNRDDENYN